MKKIRVFINGFGRIGRAAARLMLDDPRFEIVGINDLYDAAQCAYLLRYDSTQGTLPYRVTAEGNTIRTPLHRFSVFQNAQANDIDYGRLGVDILLQCTGIHLTRDANRSYIAQGAKKVIISAPSHDDTPLYIMGLNHQHYRDETIVSAASCSATAIAPVLALLHESGTVESAAVSMVHSYTADQQLLDTPGRHSERLRQRSAVCNILPLASTATRVLGRLFPELSHRIDTRSIRVPVAAGTLYDFTISLRRNVSAHEINNGLSKAAEGSSRHLLKTTPSALASTDIIGSRFGIVMETQRTRVLQQRMVRLLG